MRLKQRLEKLEQNSGERQDHKVLFVTFVDVDGTKSTAWAQILGTSIAKIDRMEGESEAAFARRVYQAKVDLLGLRHVPMEKQTDLELLTRLAAFDEVLAEELKNTGTIRSESSSEAISRFAEQFEGGPEFLAELRGTDTTETV